MVGVVRARYAVGLAAASLVAGVVGKSVFIDSDGGGSVLAYVAKYNELQREGMPVIIRGACYSSCTMALGYSNACLEPQAVLGFHPGYTPIMFGLFGYVLNPQATAVMWSHYPADARTVISRHVDLSKDPGAARDGLRWYPKIAQIKATEFPEHYLCK